MKVEIGLTPNSCSIEDGLLSGDEVTKVIARATAAKWMTSLAEWIEDEVQRGKHAELLQGLAQIQIMVHSSLTASLVAPKGYSVIAELYGEMLVKRYVEHARTSRIAARKMADTAP